MIASQLDLFDAPPPPPPPLPAPLINWGAYHDGPAVVLRHACGVRLRTATDPAAVRAAAHRWCEGLLVEGWSAFYDPGAEGRPDLHPWTAIHEAHDAVSAPTLPELAWAAWRAAQSEHDLPDVADDLLRALFLAGWRWDRFDFVRGAERLELLSAGELWYIAEKGLKA